MLFSLNSCVNPFIYAQTIPAFKKLVQTTFCKSQRKETNKLHRKRNYKFSEMETEEINPKFDSWFA